MSDLPVEKGTTEMLIEAMKDDEGFGFSPPREDQIRQALDHIPIDDFLRALIADCDAEEILILLSIIKGLEVAGKPVKEIIVVADDNTKTRYKKNW